MNRDERFEFLSTLGCVACYVDGYYRTPAVIHHLTGTAHRGMGQKAPDEKTIPLCPAHHRKVHEDAQGFVERYGLQGRLLEIVDDLMAHPEHIAKEWNESWNI